MEIKKLIINSGTIVVYLLFRKLSKATTYNSLYYSKIGNNKSFWKYISKNILPLFRKKL